MLPCRLRGRHGLLALPEPLFPAVLAAPVLGAVCRIMGCDKWHKSISRRRFWRAPHRSAPLLRSTFTMSRNRSLAFLLHPLTDDHVHVNGMISSLLQLRRLRLREIKSRNWKKSELELGLRSSFGSQVPECHATLRGTPECFLCLDGCCRLLLKQTRSPSRREAEPRGAGDWLQLGTKLTSAWEAWGVRQSV